MPTDAQNGPATVRKWGEFHRDGKYYRFTRGTVLVVRGWPHLQAWRKTPKAKAWRMVRPHLRVDLADPLLSDTTPKKSCLTFDRFDPPITPEQPCDDALEGLLLGGTLPSPTTEEGWRVEMATRAAEARARFVGDFPADVRDRLARFEERQWHLAVLMARCNGGADLVDSTPALAWMLASSWCFRSSPVKQPLRAARRVLERRQVEIAGWLGLPATHSTISVLRKVPAAACRMAILHPLSRLLKQDQAISLLRHAPRVNGSTVALLREPRWLPLVSPRLLADILTHGGDTSAARGVGLLRDTVAMIDHLHLRRMAPFASFAALQRYHDACVDRMSQEEVSDGLTLPSPPIAGTDSIRPLRTSAALLAEGRLQRNCVGAYAPLVSAGTCFIYRVDMPERSTLAIEPAAQGWRIRELVGPANSPVSPGTVAAVQAWLDDAARPRRPR